MTDMTELGDLVKRLANVRCEGLEELCWEAGDRIDALAAKLAEAERVARYESDIAQQALDQMKAEKARAEAAEARIAHLENHIEGVAKDTHKIMVAYEAALPAVYQLALADTYLSRDVLPDPTADELMARINEGEKE